MPHKSLIMIVSLVAFAFPAFAAEPVMRRIPDAEIVGAGRLTFAFWDVYDATLYAPQGEFTGGRPFALSIQYMREIEGGDIADRSVQEMRGQGFSDEERLARWNAEMKNIFPDVRNGSVLTAIFLPGGKTFFYYGNKPIGHIADAEFTRRFADIWLSEKTSEPALRRRLLGLS